jgi:CRISPR-associated protein Cas2
MMDSPGWYLVAYDVCEPRRLQRVHRRLRREGMALQKSVFLVQRSQQGIAELLDELAALMHRREDDLRAYPIPGPGEIWLRGKGVMDGELIAPDGRERVRPTGPAPSSWWRRLLGRS